MLNTLTVDVEDYYHVSAFESVIRFADCERFESRVENNIYHLLELMESIRRGLPFLFWGGLPNDTPN
jgi:peptidoglycan-N-acetylglucosamine deacetylase